MRDKTFRRTVGWHVSCYAGASGSRASGVLTRRPATRRIPSSTGAASGETRKENTVKTPHISAAYAVPATVAGERNDCGVRALMVAACIDYATAHAHCRSAGRINGAGMRNDQMQYAIRRAGFLCAEQRNAARVVKYTTRRIGNYILSYDHPMRREYFPTLAEFAATNPHGHFIINVRGHYVAICDGIIQDWQRMGGRSGARAKRGVISFWKLV